MNASLKQLTLDNVRTEVFNNAFSNIHYMIMTLSTEYQLKMLEELQKYIDARRKELLND